MIPFPSLPFSPRILLAICVTFVLLASHTTAYVYGRKHVRAQWEQERAAMKVMALKQDVQNRAKEAHDQKKLKTAEVMYGKQMLVTRELEHAYVRGLRDAAANPVYVSGDSEPAGSCPVCATRAELLGIGEDLIRVAGAADTERAAVIACAAAWPTNTREQ